MATDLEKLVVQLSADIKGYERAMQRAAGIMNQQARAIENRARQMNKNLDGLMKQATQNLLTPLSAIGAALGARELAQMTNVWTDLTSRVNRAAGSMSAGADVMVRLGEIARRTFSSLEMTAESYLANATALRELGYDTQQQLDYTEALNNALVISAAKGDRAAAIQNALAKAMAGGTLAGDDLNTVIQQGGRVAEALAAGLGVGVNQLRALGSEGKLTSSTVFRALTSQMATLRKEAEAMPATIADGLQLLRNALLEYVGGGDQAVGISAKIAEALVVMADNFEATADVALQLASVLAGALLGRSIAGMISKLSLGAAALVKFTAALRAASSAARVGLAMSGLTAAAGPIGMILGGTVVAALGLYASSSMAAEERTARFQATLKELGLTAPEAADGLDQIAAAQDGLAKRMASLEAKMSDAKGELADFSAALKDALVPFEAMGSNPFNLQTGDAARNIVDLVEKFQRGETSADDLKAALDGVSRAQPSFASAIANIIEYASKIDLATASLERLKGAQGQAQAGPSFRAAETQSMAAYEAMRATNKAFTDAAERRNSLTKDQLALETEIANVRKDADAAGAVLTEGQIKALAQANLVSDARRSAEGKKPSSRVDEFEREVAQMRARTMALAEETAAQAGLNPLVDDYGLTIERLRAAQDLLAAAQQSGVAAGKELADVQQLLSGNFDGLSPRAREQAEAMLALANEYAGASVEAEKLAQAQDQARRSAEEMRDLGRDVFGGLISDLREGKSATEALAGALEKVANKLIDIGLNDLFGGGGGSGFGAIGKLLGFSSGGYTGGSSRSDVRGVVHGREFVVNAEATARHRGLLEAINAGAGAGAMLAPSIPKLAPVAADVAPVVRLGDTHIDARGSQMSEAEFAAILKQNNQRLIASLPDTIKKLQRDRVLR
ncbi:tape measure protein [Kaistia sp. MMO-174]|uniref:tape measure protein n=1 Tax=Kaistia sp. MMO-174 TaxID=3081256 RepID=UPI003018A11A